MFSKLLILLLFGAILIAADQEVELDANPRNPEVQLDNGPNIPEIELSPSNQKTELESNQVNTETGSQLVEVEAELGGKPSHPEEQVVAKPSKPEEVVVVEPSQPEEQVVVKPTKPEEQVVVEPTKPEQEVVVEPTKPEEEVVVEPTKPEEEVAVEPTKPEKEVVVEPTKPEKEVVVEPTKPEEEVVVEPTKPEEEVVIEPSQPEEEVVVEPSQPEEEVVVEPSQSEEEIVVDPNEPEAEQENEVDTFRNELIEKLGKWLKELSQKLDGELSSNSEPLPGVVGRLRNTRLRIVGFTKGRVSELQERYEILQVKLQNPEENAVAISVLVHELIGRSKGLSYAVQGRSTGLKIRIKHLLYGEIKPENREILEGELKIVQTLVDQILVYPIELTFESRARKIAELGAALNKIQRKFNALLEKYKEKLGETAKPFRDEADKAVVEGKVKAAEFMIKLVVLREQLKTEENKNLVLGKLEELRKESKLVSKSVKNHIKVLKSEVKRLVAEA